MLVITVVETISVVIVVIISVETVLLVSLCGTVELSDVGYVIRVVEPVLEELPSEVEDPLELLPGGTDWDAVLPEVDGTLLESPYPGDVVLPVEKGEVDELLL